MDNDVHPAPPPPAGPDESPTPTPVGNLGGPSLHQPSLISRPDVRPAQPQGEPEFSDQPSSSTWREVLSFVGILALAFGIAVLMVAFVFRSYQVEGPSMETTLENQDKLIIWKVPRTWARFTHHAYLPHRGDVVVFTESDLSQFGQEDTKQLIKRVIGLPGERVVVSSGQVTVYNKSHPTGFSPDKTLPYGKVITTTSGDVDVTLGPDQLFVCGDNRPDSLDSRTFGPIDADQLIGKLVLRVFPVSQAKTF